MKKYIKTVSTILVLSLCVLLFIGCFDKLIKKVDVSFTRLDIGKRTNDYYFDFSVIIDNPTDKTETISVDDFEVEINGKKISTLVLLYAYEEVFYSLNASVNANDSLRLRVRATSQIRENEPNTLLLKYKDKVLAEDTLNIRDTTK